MKEIWQRIGPIGRFFAWVFVVLFVIMGPPIFAEAGWFGYDYSIRLYWAGLFIGAILTYIGNYKSIQLGNRIKERKEEKRRREGWQAYIDSDE